MEDSVPYDAVKHNYLFLALVEEGVGLFLPNSYLTLPVFRSRTRVEPAGSTAIDTKLNLFNFNRVTDSIYISSPSLTWRGLISVIVANEPLLGPLIRCSETLLDLIEADALDALGGKVFKSTNSQLITASEEWLEARTEVVLSSVDSYYLRHSPVPLRAAKALLDFLSPEQVDQIIQGTVFDHNETPYTVERNVSEEVSAYLNQSPIAGDECWILKEGRRSFTPALNLEGLWRSFHQGQVVLSSTTFAVGAAVAKYFQNEAAGLVITTDSESREQLLKAEGDFNEALELSHTQCTVEQWEDQGRFSLTIYGEVYSGSYRIIPDTVELVVEAAETLESEYVKLQEIFSGHTRSADPEHHRLILDNGCRVGLSIGSRYSSFRSPCPSERGYYGSRGPYITSTAREALQAGLSITYSSSEEVSTPCHNLGPLLNGIIERLFDAPLDYKSRCYTYNEDGAKVKRLKTKPEWVE